MVKTSPSYAGDAGSSPGWASKTLLASQPKNQNINNIVTNSIKTLKMVCIQKKNLRRKKKWEAWGAERVGGLECQAQKLRLCQEIAKSMRVLCAVG